MGAGGSGTAASEREHDGDGPSQLAEPRMRYSRLGSDVPGILASSAATALAVSGKVLALGTADGSVHVLDVSGTQVQSFREHKAGVTDLSFDEEAESLASSSADGTVVVYSLYAGGIERHRHAHPVTTVSLDPRYSARKTREVTFGTSEGAVILSSRGWLGTRETVLHQDASTVASVRRSGPYLAWITADAARIYDAANHILLGVVSPPGSRGAEDAAGRHPGPAPRPPDSLPPPPPTIFWGAGHELFCSWPSGVAIVRPVPAALSADSRPSVQVVSRFPTRAQLVGIAPFGTQLLVLACPGSELEVGGEEDDEGGDGAASDGGEGGEGSEGAATDADEDDGIDLDLEEAEGGGREGDVRKDGAGGDELPRGSEPGEEEPTPLEPGKEEPAALEPGEGGTEKQASKGRAKKTPSPSRLLEPRPAATSTRTRPVATPGAAASALAAPDTPPMARFIILGRDGTEQSCEGVPWPEGHEPGAADSAGYPFLAALCPVPVTFRRAASGEAAGFGRVASTEGRPPDGRSGKPSRLGAEATPASFAASLAKLSQAPDWAPSPGSSPSTSASSRPPLPRLGRSPAGSLGGSLVGSFPGPRSLTLGEPLMRPGGDSPLRPPPPQTLPADGGAPASITMMPTHGAVGPAGAAGAATSALRAKLEDSARNGPGHLAPAAGVPGSPSPGSDSAHVRDRREEAPSRWWRDGEEPAYYVVRPRCVASCRPLDGADRVAWLRARGRYEVALVAAERDPLVPRRVRAVTGEALLRSLGSQGRWAEAARWARRALGEDVGPWERWAGEFEAAGALGELAPELPTWRPTLARATYSRAVRAVLRDRSARGAATLLSLVEGWPKELVDARALAPAALAGARAEGAAARPREALQAAALLCTRASMPDAAVGLLVELEDAAGAARVAREARRLAALAPHAAELLRLDPEGSLRVLVHHSDEVAPGEVVAALRHAEKEAAGYSEAEGAGAGDERGGEAGPGEARGRAASRGRRSWGRDDAWSRGALPSSRASSAASSPTPTSRTSSPSRGPHRSPPKQHPAELRRSLHCYLRELAKRDPAAEADFADDSVALLAEFDPNSLRSYLVGSSGYSLERALEVCERRQLTSDVVFVLGRMGASDRALRIILRDLRDVPGAIEFCSAQRDDALWPLLVELALEDAALAGALLDHAGGQVDPLEVVSRLPPKLRIPRLRDRLVAAISEARASAGLRESCAAILRADSLDLTLALYRAVREALPAARIGAFGGAAEPGRARAGGRVTASGEDGDAIAAASGPSIVITTPFIEVDEKISGAGPAEPRRLRVGRGRRAKV